MRLEAVLFHRVAAVIVNRHRQEVILNVRPGELARLRMKPPASNWLLAPTLVPLNSHSAPIFGWLNHCSAGYSDTGFAGVLQVHLQVVLQVFPDARQIVHHVDVQAFQQRRRADARTLQNLRRGDGAGVQQHFAARFGIGHDCCRPADS